MKQISYIARFITYYRASGELPLVVASSGYCIVYVIRHQVKTAQCNAHSSHSITTKVNKRNTTPLPLFIFTVLFIVEDDVEFVPLVMFPFLEKKHKKETRSSGKA